VSPRSRNSSPNKTGTILLDEQFSVADAAVAPILQRFTAMLKDGIDSYKAGERGTLLKGVL